MIRKWQQLFRSEHRYLYSYRDENLLIMGPRQAAKTPFVKLVIGDLIVNKRTNPKNIIFLSCDLIDKRADLSETVER